MNTKPPAEGPYAHREVTQYFVFVKIPLRHHDGDPLHLREEHIDAQLQAQGLGTVLGWGDSLGERRRDGSRHAAYLRIDISLSDLGHGLALLRSLLPTLEAPQGTEIHYTLEGRPLIDRVVAEDWLLAQVPPVPQADGPHTV
jgi:hypothetical protein